MGSADAGVASERADLRTRTHCPIESLATANVSARQMAISITIDASRLLKWSGWQSHQELSTCLVNLHD
jgi:hypothetical protein